MTTINLYIVILRFTFVNITLERKRMKRTLLLLLTLALFFPVITAAHCEIPCGIYDDSLRISLMREHITTMEKSINQITNLSAEGEKNYNQLVRWITNKESHADKFSEIVTQYFMTQRLKPISTDNSEYQKYQQQLTSLHNMLVSAMKCKQTNDLAHIQKLRELVDTFEKAYFTKK